MRAEVVREGPEGPEGLVGPEGPEGKNRGYRRVIGLSEIDPQIAPYDFGGIDGIRNIVPEFQLLNPSYNDILQRHFHFKYFGTLCEQLLERGYEPKKTLFGLPYDPRRLLETEYRREFFRGLRETIEQCLEKPTLVAHSMGGILLKWFLSDEVSPEWIQEHVGRLIVVNAPFGGTTMALRVIISGEYYVPMFHQEFKDSLQKMSGILMCLPNAAAYSMEEPLVRIDSPARLLRLKDFMVPLHSSDSLQTGIDIWRDLYLPHLPTILRPLNLGEIPCSILMGSAQPTMKRIKIKREGELPYYTQYEDGDGQVPARSLRLALDIFHGNNVSPMVFPDCSHINILSHKGFLGLF
jgi:pimeloyl-ACP methyl ester carboxylesterase